jgi:hypothetical protein
VSGALVLAAGPLELAVDPARGAEVVSLRWEGRELLYRAHWPQEPAGPPPVDDERWTRAWPGGWQLLAPNAGLVASVDGVEHGFHGDLSVRPAELVDADDASLSFRWDDGRGLEVERAYAIDPEGVRARTRLHNASDRPLPYLLVEHVVLGGPLAGAEATIELAGGTLVPQTWEGAEAAPGEPWPLAAGEDWSRLGPAPMGRFGVVRTLPEGRATVRAPAAPTVELRWSLDAMPHLWLWQERRLSTEPPWDGITECLAIEPSLAPSADGLAAAVARGEARVLPPGGRANAALELEIGGDEA